MRFLRWFAVFVLSVLLCASAAVAESGVRIPSRAIDHIIHIESGGNPNAVSPVGAQGLMQVMPATARDPGFGVKPLKNPWDPQDNRRFGRSYFSALLAEFGSVKHALMAYNWGPYNVKRWIDRGKPSWMVPHETKRYVRLLEQPVREAIMDGYRDRLYKDLKDLAYDNYNTIRDGTRWQTEVQTQSRSTSKIFRDALLNLKLLHSLSQQERLDPHLRTFFSQQEQASPKRLLERSSMYPQMRKISPKRKPQYVMT